MREKGGVHWRDVQLIPVEDSVLEKNTTSSLERCELSDADARIIEFDYCKGCFLKYGLRVETT